MSCRFIDTQVMVAPPGEALRMARIALYVDEATQTVGIKVLADGPLKDYCFDVRADQVVELLRGAGQPVAGMEVVG